MNRILVSLGSLPLIAFELRQGVTRLGRTGENDIVLPLPEIAERHAEITLGGGRASIRALGGDPLRINGKELTESPLSPGDVIRIGGYRLRWSAGREDAPVSWDAFASDGAVSHPTEPLEGPSPAPGGSVRRLIVVGGRDVGLTVDFEGPSLLVGRSPDCDLVLQDPTVSWRHAGLERTSGGLRVRDMGSRNGTYLDGARIEAGLGTAGCRVRVGRTTLRLAIGLDPAEPGNDGSEKGAKRGLAELTGGSAPMRELYARILETAPARVPVLLLGETGTGKELAARALHALGPGSGGPFIPINCAAVPKEILEDQLFGHVKGAFTGAISDHLGVFEQASGGTLFLDEISELPLELQPKLLRVLDDGLAPRLGGTAVSCDCRIVAASNRDLAREAAEGTFRKDLFFRLAVCQIFLPPLRDRIEDLPDLVHAFLASAERHTGLQGSAETRFEEEAMIPLREHLWPGNVRELRNLVLSAVVRAPRGPVDRKLVESLLDATRLAKEESKAPRSLEEIEKEAIRNALHDCDGNRRAAARRLGIAESTLYEKIRRYGLTG